jgi:hypothetical protein
MCNENQSGGSFLEQLGKRVLVCCVVLAVAVLLVPALAGGAAGGALVGVGALLLKWSWAA